MKRQPPTLKLLQEDIKNKEIRDLTNQKVENFQPGKIKGGFRNQISRLREWEKKQKHSPRGDLLTDFVPNKECYKPYEI